MGDSYTFAVDVVRTVCDRLAAKAADLRLLVAADESFEEWLAWEAFLACELRQTSYPICEVTAKPTYASEGVADEGGDPSRVRGDLRVGDPDDGSRAGDAWWRKITAGADKFRRSG